MRIVTWTIDFNLEEETLLAPIWITLPGLKWHYFNWDALLRITSTIGTLLKIDKATNAKTRPNSAKVMVDFDLALHRRKSIWVEMKEENGKEIRNFWKEIEYDIVRDYCFSCKHQGHIEDVCLAYGKKDPTKIVGINATQNIASSCNNRNGEFNYHKEGDKMLYCPLRLENLSRSRQKIQQGIKAKLNKKNVMKWAVRPPKDNNLQQKLSQAKDLELEVGKVQFEVHLPAVKPITTSNSFKHLEDCDKDREVCYSEDDAEIYAQDKLTKPDRDSASKLQTKSPYVLDNYYPILSGKPPKNVHNESQGINLEVQLWSPNSLVDVPLQVITPTDENSTGNHANNEDNSEDEEDEYDPDYGVEQESNIEEGSDEEFEECDYSDEDALIDAFAPTTS
ncbi:hypothetical protein KY285_007600 [Solanum tuberosum]|nr:hypothetical protein KY284_007677 [Solanum tuberosum]KAH0745943.1 hypothetical protein KY285_007600 [Solanum tuberosum]